MPDSIKQTQRTVKSFYIAPSEDKFKEVVDYIKTASESIRLLRVMEFNKERIVDAIIGAILPYQNSLSDSKNHAQPIGNKLYTNTSVAGY